MIENISIEEEEVIHPTRRSMKIFVLVDHLLVVTIELHFSMSTERSQANILDDKFIALNILRGKSGTHQYDTNFSGTAKVFSSLFGSEKYYVARSQTGESDTANKKNMRLFKRRLLEIRLSVRI